jgi:hypothetical protein
MIRWSIQLAPNAPLITSGFLFSRPAQLLSSSIAKRSNISAVSKITKTVFAQIQSVLAKYDTHIQTK